MRPDYSRHQQPTCNQAKAEVKGAGKSDVTQAPSGKKTTRCPMPAFRMCSPHSDWLERATQLKPIKHSFILLHLLIVHPTLLFVVFHLLFVSHEATSSSSVTDWLGGGRRTTESDARVCGAVRQFPPVGRLST